MRNGDTYACSGCGAVYPVKNDIIDFLHTLPLSDEQAGIQQRYDEIAASYDDTIVSLVETAGCSWSAYTDEIECFMGRQQDQCILDVGCGTAFPIGSFVPDGASYIGLDCSLKMLDRAHDFFGTRAGVALLGIDVERMPVAQDSVDACLALFSLNVMLDPSRAAKRIATVLKCHGELLVTVPVRAHNSQDTPLMNRAIDEKCLAGVLSVFCDTFEMISRRHGDILFVRLGPR